MTNQEYKEIRSKPNFLYLYFTKSGGKNVPERSFAQFLSLWLMTIGMDPGQGIAKIVVYLDSINRN